MKLKHCHVAALAAALLMLTGNVAWADTAAALLPEAVSATTPTMPAVTVGGYVESYYAWNFGRPSNGISNWRGFDNRHGAFTLSNVALDTQAKQGPMQARLVLQAGQAPNTYYMLEPTANAASGVGAVDAATWRVIQQANMGWKAPVGRGLLIESGVFLTTVGPESVPVKDSWNWSRSTVFMALPAYHTGVKATYDAADTLKLTAMIFDSWNSVSHATEAPALGLQVNWLSGPLTCNLVYYGGKERAPATTLGEIAPWRSLFDGYVQYDASTRLSLLAHADGGWEGGRDSVSSWFGAALYARYKAAEWLYIVGRGDGFREKVGKGATPIFWPNPNADGVSVLGSGTLTLDARPTDNLSIRLEARRDLANTNLYFRGSVAKSAAGADVPNADAQTTLTLGAVAWF